MRRRSLTRRRLTAVFCILVLVVAAVAPTSGPELSFLIVPLAALFGSVEAVKFVDIAPVVAVAEPLVSVRSPRAPPLA